MISKLLLLSVLVVMSAVPILASYETNSRLGLRKAILLTIAFNLLYFVGIMFALPHLK